MYGRDGWCAACGAPRHAQVGGLVLQGNKSPTSNFWMPNWQHDVLCVRASAAAGLLSDFRLQTLPVRTPRSADTGILQLLPAVSPQPWFPEPLLRQRALARHGKAGESCGQCGTWRWYPVPDSELPPAQLGSEVDTSDFVASAEIFGAGMNVMRALRFRRPLAEALVALNPRVWSIVPSSPTD